MHPKKIGLPLLALLTVSVLMPLTPNVTVPFSMSQALAQTPSSPKPEAERSNRVQVKDVLGWNNTQWSMTIQEVQALYPFRNTEPSPDGANQVGLYKVKLDGHQYEARFVFHQDKLIAVSLGWKPKAGDSTSSSSDIQKNLVSQHGTPEEKFKGMVFIWSLPTTKITLLTAGDEMATVIYENASTSIMSF